MSKFLRYRVWVPHIQDPFLGLSVCFLSPSVCAETQSSIALLCLSKLLRTSTTTILAYIQRSGRFKKKQRCYCLMIASACRSSLGGPDASHVIIARREHYCLPHKSCELSHLLFFSARFESLIRSLPRCLSFPFSLSGLSQQLRPKTERENE